MTVYAKLNGTTYLATDDDSKRRNGDLAMLRRFQALPNLQVISTEPEINVIYCRFPLTNFKVILNKDDNTALVSDDYSVILVKRKDIVYCFFDDDIKPNCFTRLPGSTSKLWYNNYNIRIAIFLKKNLFDGNTFILDDNITIKDVISISACNKYVNVFDIIAWNQLSEIGNPSTSFRIELQGYLDFRLRIDRSRIDYEKHEKTVIMKCLYVNIIMKCHGLPSDDIIPLVFCGNNRGLWKFDTLPTHPSYLYTKEEIAKGYHLRKI